MKPLDYAFYRLQNKCVKVTERMAVLLSAANTSSMNTTIHYYHYYPLKGSINYSLSVCLSY